MIASGHNWIACLIDIAECIPKALASYEAVATTPLFSGRPPTPLAYFVVLDLKFALQRRKMHPNLHVKCMNQQYPLIDMSLSR